MEFRPTAIPDVILIAPKVIGDERGFFMETYERREFRRHGIAAEFVQHNHSRSHRGVLRGLHFQVEHPQGKLVRAVSGEVFDVAVDLRSGSPTFGKWVGNSLSAENRHQVWIPPGFAHGFCVLTDWADVLYKVTDSYAPEFERALVWNDPEVGVAWPFEGGAEPIISAKDAAGASLRDLFPGGKRRA